VVLEKNVPLNIRKILAMRLTSMSLLAALWMLLSELPASAVTVKCVATNADLRDAIALSQTQAVTIKIVQGSYDMNTNKWGMGPEVPAILVHDGTSLRGGYTANCNGRDIAANNTVLKFTTFEVTPAGDLTLEGLTWKWDGHDDGTGHGSFMGWNFNKDDAHYAADPQFLIHRCVFDSALVTIQWFTDVSTGGSLRIDDSLFFNANTQFQSALGIFTEQGAPDVTLVNDTITAFNSAGVALLNHFGGAHGSATYGVYNSILWNSNGNDLSADTSAVVLVDNIIGTHSYPNLQTAPVGTLSVDPKLDSNYRPIESPPSPAINSGTTSVPDGLPAKDLPGRNRVVGSEPDRGAYESLIDDSTIQVVTNTNDAGAGSMRQAIVNANATGGTVLIKFDIGTGCGPHTIALASALPDVTAKVIVDGFTQTGASPNDLYLGDDAVLCIILDGTTHGIGNGLRVAQTAPSSTVADIIGLAFSGFGSAAIRLEGGHNHFVGGNQIGGLVGFNFLGQVANGIVVGPGVAGVLIGGSDPANRNLVGVASNDGIVFDGASGNLDAAHDNQIINNYVGVGWNPSGSFTNNGNANKGILVAGYSNTVNGNVISYNGNDGIDLDGGHDNRIDHNDIGSSPLLDNLGNGSMGVRVENDGHDNIISDNTIAYNQQKGVRILTGTGNRVTHNTMHDNVLLGIDLAGEGITPNDDDATPPAPDYANRGQNFPVIVTAIGGHSAGTATGNLTTTAGDYTLEVFGTTACDASGYGEGEIFMGSDSVTVPIPTSGDQSAVAWSFALNFPRPLHLPPYISTTITDTSGNTSEFSNCFPYTDDTIFADGFEPALLF
jgi:parallel beta-helix repeat protein